MVNDELTTYRMQRAFETLEEAKLLFENESYNGVANRLYYSAFYAVSALLAAVGLDAKTHRGVKNLFYQEFIGKNLLNRELSGIYQHLLELRTDGDYEDFVSLSSSDVEGLVGETANFITAIQNHLGR